MLVLLSYTLLEPQPEVGVSWGVMVTTLDCRIIGYEFEL